MDFKDFALYCNLQEKVCIILRRVEQKRRKYKMKKKLFIFLTCLMIECLASDRFELNSTRHEQRTVSKEVITQLDRVYRNLDISPNFKTANIKNNKWVKEQFAKIKEAEEIEICTEDKCYIECTYINKGNDTIIISAPGFGSSREQLIPYLDLFADFDLLLVNYWGKSSRKTDNPTYNRGLQYPAYKYFSHRWIREMLDIKAAVKYIRNLNKYKQVIGVAKCYSTLRFCEVQALAEQNKEAAFDKLILDSPWLSMQSVAEKVSGSPFLCCTQTSDKTPTLLKLLFRPQILRSALIALGRVTFQLDFRKISIIDPISQITQCPILFIYGKNDAFVIESEFNKIWNSVQTQKLALITPFGHSANHIKGKAIYKFITNMFIQTNHLDNFCNLANAKIINENVFNIFLKPEVKKLIHEYVKDELICSPDGKYMVSLVE